MRGFILSIYTSLLIEIMQVHRSLGRSGLTLRNFTTKTACITGATSGIGKAYAEEFYQKGYSLGLIGRRLEGL